MTDSAKFTILGVNIIYHSKGKQLIFITAFEYFSLGKIESKWFYIHKKVAYNTLLQTYVIDNMLHISLYLQKIQTYCIEMPFIVGGISIYIDKYCQMGI